MIEAKATVISIVPFAVNAQKPTIHPGDFIIPKSDGKTPEFLVVGESGYDVYMGAERRPMYLRVKCSPYDIAKAIVEDFIGSVIATNSESFPGIFFVPMEIKSIE